MDALWHEFVGLVFSVLVQLTHSLGGSLGLAIITLSLIVRLALLPLSTRMAWHGWLHRRGMHTLKPQMDRLRERHRNDPMALAKATRELHHQHGISTGLGQSLKISLLQMPILLALDQAVRRSVAHAGAFLWIRSLARPDLLLAVLVGIITALAIMLTPGMPDQVRTVLQFLPVLIMFAMVWHMSAGFGLYLGVSGTINVVQAALVRRRAKRHEAALTNAATT